MAKFTVAIEFDDSNLEVLKLTINGNPAVDQGDMKIKPMDLTGYAEMSAFQAISFMVFRDDRQQVAARYVKLANCTYLWI